MKTSIIIPAFNEEKYISQCIEHCLKHAPGVEIIVVDNASTDKTAQIAKSYKGVRVLHEAARGVNLARQTGFANSLGDLVAFIDADSRMPAGWIERAEKEFSNDKNMVLLSGPYVYYDQGRLGRFLVEVFWILLGLPAYYVFGYLAIGGNCVARRDALEISGGFDPAIVFYGDDADFARRLYDVGKVKFDMDFFMFSSARRLTKEGAIVSAMLYIYNYLSVVFTHHPRTLRHRDIR